MSDDQYLNNQLAVQQSNADGRVIDSRQSSVFKDEHEHASASQNHILEQYKMYVEMTDRISARRGQANAFYTSLLTGLLAVISIAFEKGLSRTTQNNLSGLHGFLALLVAILGLILSLVWCLNILSYKQLNSLKYRVIHEIEAHLPLQLYKQEWEILKSESGRKYFRLTRIESYVPIALGGVYLSLVVYVVINLIN